MQIVGGYPVYSELVHNIARRIRDTHDWDALLVLADALEEDGCENRVMLDHLREYAHNDESMYCWVVTQILERE